MNIKFIVNDYVLMWHILFGASISENIYKLKQKIWDTYKTEYNTLFYDKSLILSDYKNFIPRNDNIYNILLETKEYEKIKKQTEKYRMELMNIWDKNKKNTENLIKRIVRIPKEDYNAFVVSQELNVLDKEGPSIIIGKEINKKDSLKILIELNYFIVKNMLKQYNEEDRIFKKAILELAIVNEYATELVGRSCYQIGNPAYQKIKRYLYPYWLMYLGVPQDEFFSYMMRDQIAFEVDKYAYEKELKKMNLGDFIDFCIRNKKYIIRD